MRQAGIIAAAGLISLQEMTKRLHIDHANAQTLAAGLAELPGIEIDTSAVYTNLVFFKLAESVPLSYVDISAKLKTDYNILMSGGYHTTQFRAVTHYWITEKEVDALLNALQEILQSAPN